MVGVRKAMTTSGLGTTEIQALLDRNRAGDRHARELLAKSVYDRLAQLAHQMLRRYPRVREQHETGDVLNNAMIRFLRAVDVTPIRDTSHFYALAAEQIRRELIDLARKAKSILNRTTELQPSQAPPADHPAQQNLDDWCAFHSAVDTLPDEERAVFEPVFYHDITQRELAEQLGVSAKTVQRRYRNACVHLYERLEAKLPGI